MKVVCVAGEAQNGKDTFAMLCAEIVKENGGKVLITHNADLLKYMCRSLFDWDGKKDERGRTLLQYVGTDVVRKKMPDYWIDYIVSVLKLFDGQWDYVFIPDCRFPNEVNKVASSGFDTTSVKIVRQTPGWVSPLTEEQRNHISERAMDNFAFDHVVINNGTIEDLKKKARELCDAWAKQREEVKT